MKPTLEQRLRRIEEKVSSKKRVTEAVDLGEYGPETLEKIQIENHRIAMARIKNLKKLIQYLEKEYGSIFLRYKVIQGLGSENDLSLICFFLTDTKNELYQLGEAIQDDYDEISVYPFKGDSKFNLRISI